MAGYFGWTLGVRRHRVSQESAVKFFARFHKIWYN